MLSTISICWIPDVVKFKSWRMWEYRALWRDLHMMLGFESAWEHIRKITNTYMLIEKIKCSR